jgi:small-conductance mechanosensitive channel
MADEGFKEPGVPGGLLQEYLLLLDTAEPLHRLLLASSTVAISLLLIGLVRFMIGRRQRRIEALPDEKIQPLRVQRQELLSSTDVRKLRVLVLRILSWGLTLALGVWAVVGLLMLSRWTQSLGMALVRTVFETLALVFTGIVDYLPDLITILCILLIARAALHMVKVFFEGIGSRRIRLPNFYPEWADTSYTIIRLLVITLTAVIIFPYLPGSSSPAFQGISIFIGVLVSLGSTTAVANVVAGVVLTYTRAFQVGDQVEVAETRGRVVERTTFVTRIQTLKNVIVSLPNSMVLNNQIINYSQNMGQRGLLVHTGITIGYDVPWQTVNELLVRAAGRTEHIVETPPPFVLQKSLDDNYVSYEINAWTRSPEELPQIYSSLHANILDEFHGRNVEITSPAYRAVRDGNAPAVPPGDSSAENV